MSDKKAILKCPETGNNIEMEFKTITPSMARKILNTNHASNRTIKTAVVESYASQIISDEWHPASCEAIKISSTGELIDGQHRCHAVIKADKAATFLVINNVPPCSFTAIDDGVSRTLADALQIGGVKIKCGSQRAATCLKSLLHIYQAQLSGAVYSSLHRRKPSLTSAMSFHKKLPRFNATLSKFTGLYTYSHIQKNFGTPVLMALYYVFDGIDEKTDNALHTICLSLESGTPFDDLKNKSPVYHVIQDIRAKREKNTIIRFYEYFSLFIWCLDKTIQGVEVYALPKELTDFKNYDLAVKDEALTRFMAFK